MTDYVKSTSIPSRLLKYGLWILVRRTLQNDTAHCFLYAADIGGKIYINFSLLSHTKDASSTRSRKQLDRSPCIDTDFPANSDILG